MNKWLLTAGLIGTATQALAVADTTAPTVSASVKSGTYTVAQSVKLAIKDNVDLKPNLYYTIDGSTPSIRSKLYRGETIQVTDTNTDDAAIDLKIRTLAMDINGNVAKNSFSYRIKTVDTVAPKISATPASGTYDSAQKIVLKVTDDKDKAPKLYYTLDGAVPTTSSVLYKDGQVINAVDIGSGVDLRVRTLAVDAAGNKSSRNFNYIINGENNPPVVAVSPLPGKFDKAQTVAFTLTDDTDKAPKLYYTLDGSEATTSSALYSASLTIDKDTVINTLAVDATGKSVKGSYQYQIAGDEGIGDGYLLDQFVAPGISIYVKTGWSTTNLHSFNVLPAGVSADTKWPGNKMSDAGNGWSTASFPGASSVSMVFNNGSGTQYPSNMGKETRTESGCLDLSTKVWTGLADCPAPIEFGVTSSVPSGSFGSDEQEVTLSIMGAAADATGYLTLDGVAPTAAHGLKFKNGQKLRLGKNSAIGKSIKLWISAEGKDATYTYTKAEKKEVKVQIYAPDWSSANAHYFNVTPSTVANSVWPGAVMTPDADNKGWFTYTLQNAEVASFVFNSNGTSKSLDFVGAKSGCYKVSAGAMPTATECPTPVAIPTASPEGGNFYGQSVDVKIGYIGKDVTAACYTEDGSDPAVACKTLYENGKVITVGKSLKEGETETLRLYAKNALGATPKSFTFTKKKPGEVLFTWDNATVYFVLTDRFRNGDISNDHSYGRECPKSAYDKMTGKVNTAQCWSGYEKHEGNFRGGDLKGMLEKLNAGYFTDLGVNAIWLSVPFEQIHGYVGGEDFKYYGYHGYWASDLTNIDANIGDKALMKEFIDTAHKKGIRIIFDVAINHLGYDSMQDADEYGFGAMNPGWENYYYTSNNNQANYKSYGPYFNYGSSNWSKWWGSDWVRAKAYGTCTSEDDINKCLDGLPDVRGEVSNDVALPQFLVTKWTREGRLATEQASLDSFFQKSGLKRTPANYMIKWLTDWVREYGVDGFRCDTAKHIQISVWKELKAQANIALKEWQAKPGVIKPDSQDLPFWMTAEVYDFAIGRPVHSTYHDNGFDSVINFEFQGKVAGNIAAAESNFSSYANAINSSHTWNVLNYLSSHDTSLYNRADLINGGTTLLLSPGAAQIFYGDETARPIDPYGPHWNEKFRSNMNWCDGSLGSDLSPCVDKAVLAHWQKLGQFRNRHPAIGAGSHAKLADTPYTFKREYKGDAVVVAFASGQQSISVGSVFADGAEVVDAYTGSKATVSGGKVNLNAGGVVLLEKSTQQ